MSSAEKMLEAIKSTFPAVDKLCMLSEEESSNLLQTLERLPEKAVDRMVKDGKIRLDEDAHITTPEIDASVIGPESDLGPCNGTMKISLTGREFGEKCSYALEIICNASPKVGQEIEVLCYSHDKGLYQRTYRSVYITMNQDGSGEVFDEVYDKAKLRGYTSSDYRGSSYR